MYLDSQSIQNWFVNWGQPILIAIIILIVAHFAAKAVKWAIAKGVDRIPFLSRRDSAGPAGAKPSADIGERVGCRSAQVEPFLPQHQLPLRHAGDIEQIVEQTAHVFALPQNYINFVRQVDRGP